MRCLISTVRVMALAAIAAGALGVAPAPVVAATTFVVNKVGDAADLNLANSKCDTSAKRGKQCTLRAAIQEANDTPGADTINFNITSASKVIAPASPLPPITGRVTINGYSQSGASANTQATGNNAVLKIVLDGINADDEEPGLVVEASRSFIRGLVIQRFSAGAIVVWGNDNVIAGNFIGTDAAGTAARGNVAGVNLIGANNVVGGTSPAARNVISGNEYGIQIVTDGASGNRVEGNYIGTTKSGQGALGNGLDGVRILGAPNNTIGGTAAGARNVISGNAGNGVLIEQDAVGNVVQGNYIGIDAAGSADLGNGTGDGISAGVFVSDASENTIGGTAAGARNIISGNDGHGVAIDGTANVLQGNFIGTDVTGTVALGNGSAGVFIDYTSSENTIGGTVAGAGNVISGNADQGVTIVGDDNTVQGNRIGTKHDGTGDLGNAQNGVIIFGSDNLVGGAVAAAANVISGNGADGVRITGFADGNTVQGNLIRLNNFHGARLSQGPNTVSGNAIFENGISGVQVGPSTQGIRIVGNQFLANGGLGIDLVGGTENSLRVTANDDDDPDTGANDLQNFPVLTSAVRSNATGVTSVLGSLNSRPNAEFRIDLYLVLDVDPSGHGEGQVLIATQNITTNANGDAGFSFATAQLVAGHVLTATATRVSDSSTSEFAANRAVVTGP